MSVDKFGRFEASSGQLNSAVGSNNSSSSRVLRGPPGQGFKLTDNGDYDMENKRLTNIGVPRDDGDAITGREFDNLARHALKINFANLKYDAGKVTIRQTNEPVDEYDLVNLRYLRKNYVMYGKDGVNLNNNRLFNVKGPPISDSDIINNRYLNSVIPAQQRDKWDFKAKRLTNCSDPTAMSDCVTVNYLIRVLSEVLFGFHNNVVPEKNKIEASKKEQWINEHIVRPYFLDSKTKLLRSKAV